MGKTLGLILKTLKKKTVKFCESLCCVMIYCGTSSHPGHVDVKISPILWNFQKNKHLAVITSVGSSRPTFSDLFSKCAGSDFLSTLISLTLSFGSLPLRGIPELSDVTHISDCQLCDEQCVCVCVTPTDLESSMSLI